MSVRFGEQNALRQVCVLRYIDLEALIEVEISNTIDLLRTYYIPTMFAVKFVLLLHILVFKSFTFRTTKLVITVLQ